MSAPSTSTAASPGLGARGGPLGRQAVPPPKAGLLGTHWRKEAGRGEGRGAGTPKGLPLWRPTARAPQVTGLGTPKHSQAPLLVDLLRLLHHCKNKTRPSSVPMPGRALSSEIPPSCLPCALGRPQMGHGTRPANRRGPPVTDTVSALWESRA